MKFEFSCPFVLEKMFKNVDGQTTDGRGSDWYTISSHMSLQSGELKSKQVLPGL